MENITAIATLNLKETPKTLYVKGSVLSYGADDIITISKAEPQGINPNILLLNVIVTQGSGPMKGTFKNIYYEEVGDGIENYRQVTLLHNGYSKTVDVDIQG